MLFVSVTNRINFNKLPKTLKLKIWKHVDEPHQSLWSVAILPACFVLDVQPAAALKLKRISPGGGASDLHCLTNDLRFAAKPCKLALDTLAGGLRAEL